MLSVFAAAPSAEKNQAAGLHDRLQAGHKALSEMQQMLHKYYSTGTHGQGRDVLQSAFFINATDARYRQGQQRMADKLARAILWEDAFIVGAMGSSVTAGHDNCHLDSYESQLGRIFGLQLSSTGATLEVRNGGMTGTCGDNHANQGWCQGHIVGFDADTVHYCWSYFESSKNDPEFPQRIRESWARWALLSAGSAVPLFIEADCKAAGDVTERTGVLARNIELAEMYAHLGANYMCMTRGINGVGYPGKVWGAVGDIA